MAYTVLARRYRSGTFDEVVGQGHVAQTLKKAIASGRVAHAFLFCGTRGVGKTSMARILAKALNCEKADGPTTEPCGACDSCQGIARGEDMDVIEIDAASNTGVDNVRDIIENARYRPARSRFKVYIIDEVHMLSKAAFNALLKTMEEPPEHVKFILATTEPEKVLPTILSRCQRYDFRSILTREIADHLREVTRREKVQADEDALLLVAKAGAGSMRDSLSLLDRLLSIGEKTLTIDLIEQLLGMPRGEAIFAIANQIGEGDVKGVLESADRLIREGLSPDTLIASVIDHLRNLLIVRTCGTQSNLVEVPGLSMDELKKQADRFEPVVLTQDIAILEELRRQLRSAGAGRALLDATLVRLALAEQFTPIEQLLGRSNGSSAPSGPTTGQKKKPEPVAATPIAARPATPAPVAPAPAAPAPVTPAPTSSPASSDDEDDDLPRPGKVWDNSGPSLSELLKQQSLRSHPASTPPAAAAVPDASATSNVEPVSLTDLPAVFTRFLDALAERGPAWPPLLSGAKLVGIEEGHAVLRWPHDHEQMVRVLDRNGKKETLREVMTGVVGRSMGVKLELEDKPAEAPAPARHRPTPRPVQKLTAEQRLATMPAPPPEPSSRITEEVREQLKSDPLVAAVMKELGGDIVKVE